MSYLRSRITPVNNCPRHTVAIIMPHQLGMGLAPIGGYPTAYDVIQIAVKITKLYPQKIDVEDSSSTGQKRRFLQRSAFPPWRPAFGLLQ